MNIKKIRRMAWSAVMAAGLFEVQDYIDEIAFIRGRTLERKKNARGRAYRTVRDYVIPRIENHRDESGNYYIPASLSRFFYESPMAGYYSWPILRRPENARPSDVFSRRIWTRRGEVYANPLPDGYKDIKRGGKK